MRTKTQLCLLLLTAACADVESNNPECAQPESISEQTGFSLSVSLDYQSGTLDAFDLLCPDNPKKQIITSSGDAVLANWSEGIAVINRGNASYLQFIDSQFNLLKEVSLEQCNAHDIVEIGSKEFLVTCYDSAFIYSLDLEAGTAQPWLDLSAFADDDGIPEMDRAIVIDSNLYISMQMLDRHQQYKATQVGKILTLNLDDFSNSMTPESVLPQSYDLACQNPYTRIYPYQNDMLILGCVGDWTNKETMGLAVFNLQSKESTLLHSGSDLGGPVHALYVAPQSVIQTMVSVVGTDIWDIKEMSLLQIGESVEILYAYDGFSLSGLGGHDNVLFFGNRSKTQDAGLWTYDTSSHSARGAFTTTLPPHDIMIWTP
ncbi:MAG: hypothetical protein QGI45_03940 [Myxococcota bacterium]|nr:hypothetical protein [Myxococcota bacterium]